MEGDQITSFIRGAIDASVLVQCTVCTSDDESVDDDDGRDDERQMKKTESPDCSSEANTSASNISHDLWKRSEEQQITNKNSTFELRQ